MAQSPCSVAVLLAAAAMAASGAAAAAGGGRELVQTAAAPTSGTVAEGDLRLVSQVVANGFTTGALQVFHDGQFGAVCNVGFDAVDAAVACRQLGFPAGGFALPSLSPTGSVTPVAPVRCAALSCAASSDSGVALYGLLPAACGQSLLRPRACMAAPVVTARVTCMLAYVQGLGKHSMNA
eukprot:jgi/Ulvmu1/2065/UM121_0006.1